MPARSSLVRSSLVRSSFVRSPLSDAVMVAGAAVITLAGIVFVSQSGRGVWWLTGACVVLAAAMAIRPHLSARSFAIGAERLDVSLWGLRLFDAGQLRDSVSWADLEEVAVVTTPDGSRAEDSYLVLRGTSGNGVIIPHALAVQSGVLSALPRQVAQFHSARLIEAMASADDGVHIVWRAPKTESEASAGDWQVRRWDPHFAQ